MNVLNFLSSYPVSSFKEALVPALTSQQKRILPVAALALSFLATCYLISQFCFTAKVLNDDEPIIDDEESELEENSSIAETIIEVNLSDCADLRVALTHLPKGTKKLNLSGNQQLNDELIQLLPADLEELDISGCKNITQIGWTSLPKEIKKLKLQGCFIDSYFTDDEAEMLDIFDDPALGALMEHLPQLTNLEELDLSKCNRVMDDMIEALPKGIRRLNLSDCHGLSSPSFKFLENLEDLNLANNKKISPLAIATLPNGIKKLRLMNCSQLTDDSLKHLPRDLEEVNLSGCQQLTDQGLWSLPRSIQKLWLLDNPQLKKPNFKYLTKLNTLHLSSGHNIQDDAIAQWAKGIKINIVDDGT